MVVAQATSECEQLFSECYNTTIKSKSNLVSVGRLSIRLPIIHFKIPQHINLVVSTKGIS